MQADKRRRGPANSGHFNRWPGWDAIRRRQTKATTYPPKHGVTSPMLPIGVLGGSSRRRRPEAPGQRGRVLCQTAVVPHFSLRGVGIRNSSRSPRFLVTRRVCIADARFSGCLDMLPGILSRVPGTRPLTRPKQALNATLRAPGITSALRGNGIGTDKRFCPSKRRAARSDFMARQVTNSG